MSFPSHGCRTCRLRRVKCDGERPTCGGCLKRGRDCVWNANTTENLQFKSENAFAQGATRRPRKIQQRIEESTTSDTDAPTAVTTCQTPTVNLPPPSLSVWAKRRPSIPLPPRPSPTTILPALSLPLELHALQHWASNFVFQPNDIPLAREYNSFVLSHWLRAGPNSSLRLALSALTHAIFGKIRNVPQALTDADRVYGQSILETRRETAGLGDANVNVDHLLITIMLMGFYENVMYQGQGHALLPSTSTPAADEVGSRFWKTFCHHEGALSLLKLRHERPNIPLDGAVRRQILRTAILRGTAVPAWLQDGATYGEVGPALTVDKLMVRVAGLRARSMDLLLGRDPGFGTTYLAEDISAEAMELETSLAAWSRDLPGEWECRLQVFRSGRDLEHNRVQDEIDGNDDYAGPVYSYSTCGYASIWCRWRVLRIIVSSIGIRALTSLLQYPSQRERVFAQVDVCQEVMDRMVDELCGSVFYFFNNRETEIAPKMASLVAWTLAVTVSTERVSEARRRWLKSRLRSVAESAGDAILMSILEQSEFRF